MTDIFKSADWAREGLEREEAAKRGPAFIVDNAALQAILSDPVAVRELMRPGGIIVIEDGAPIPDAATLNQARGLMMTRTMTRAEAEEIYGP